MTRSPFLERLMQFCQTDSLTRLAELTKVPVNTLKNYQDEDRLPAAPILMQIAKETGASLNWLLLGGEPPATAAVAGVPNSLDIHIPAINITVRFSQAGNHDEVIPILRSAPITEHKDTEGS